MLFYPKNENEDAQIALIIPRYQGKWLYINYEGRKTFTFPTGYRKENESLADAADRVLREESGALDFSVWPVSAFGALQKDGTVHGELFFADIRQMGRVLSEKVTERCLFDEPEEDYRAKNVQRQLLDKVEKWLIDERTLLFCISAAETSASRILKTYEACRIDGVISSPEKTIRAAMNHLAEDRDLTVSANPDMGENFAEDFRRKGIEVFREILDWEKGRSLAIGMHEDAVGSILEKYKAWLKADTENLYAKYYREESGSASKANVTVLLEFIEDKLIGVRDSWTKES